MSDVEHQAKEGWFPVFESSIWAYICLSTELKFTQYILHLMFEVVAVAVAVAIKVWCNLCCGACS